MKRKKQEEEQEKKIKENNNQLKILLAGHPYNLYDNLIGKSVEDFLKQNNITILYSDKIKQDLIQEEYQKIAPDIHWTHNKEIVASAKYYENIVDGQITHQIKKIPIITLLFEDLNNEAGVITRLESFLDILMNLKEEKSE